MPKNEKIRLKIRYTVSEDAIALAKWLRDDEVLNWFPIIKTKHDIDHAVKYWIGYSKSKSSLTAEINGHACGISTLYVQPYSKVAHQSELGIIINKKWRNKGVGTVLLNNIALLATRVFNFELLHLQVYAGNPAISLYKRLGFTEFGKHEHWIRESNGQYRTCLFMTRKMPFKPVLNRCANDFVVERQWQ